MLIQINQSIHQRMVIISRKIFVVVDFNVIMRIFNSPKGVAFSISNTDENGAGALERGN